MLSKSVKTDLIKVLKKYVSESYVHGLPRVFKSEKNLLVKSLWLTFILVNFGVCCFYVYSNILEFLNYEVITKIETISEVPKIFPKTTICNNNPFVSNYSMEFLESIRGNLTNNFWIDQYLPSFMAVAKNPEEQKLLGYRIEVGEISSNLLCGIHYQYLGNFKF